MKKLRFVLALALMLACLLGLSAIAQAVNPYMDLWEHVPDGEPHVFGDRVYVYGSHDVFETRMCGPNYVVWSAPVDDLTNWKYEGVSFDGGESGYLLAPDVCQGPDGKYYLYTFGDCDQGGKGQTFCAVAEKPEGPFEYLGPVTIDGKSQFIFDPAVLVDDDGSVYLFGGSSNIWKLDPKDMRTVIEGPFQVQEDDGKGNLVQIRNFQEGSSIRKVDGWYVFAYASKYPLTTDHLTNNTNNNDYYNGTMEYAYSKNIYGPYTYGGTLIDNGGEVLHPSESTIERTNFNGNTHGGMAKINGQWYLFYHRQTNDCQTYRQGMCEPIAVTSDENGVYIEQAEMTSQGAEKDGLNPEKEYSAGIACYLTNFAYINTDVEMYDTLTPVTNIRNSATVGYKYFNFTGKNYELFLNVRPNGINGRIDMVLDDPENEPVASFDLTARKSDYYATLTRAVGKLSGKHAVFFNFYAVSQDEICDFGSFGFREAVPGGMTQTVYKEGNAACDHTYVRQSDSVESTDTKTGLRHFKCSKCGAEYAYTTDPMVYADGFKKANGEIVDVNEGNIGAVNPYLPEYIHACDGEPKVNWSKEDGEWRVYVYASYDMKATGYCGPQCIVASAPVYDLSDWRVESYPNSAMASLAPDCTYNPYNDKYYFVKNMPGEIWVSDHPGYGFDDVRVFDESSDKTANPDNVSMFDSALYITEDGTMYEFSCKLGTVYTVAKLLPKDNYSRFDSYYVMKTAGKPELNSMQNIYEGPSIRYLKDEGIYVLVYASQYLKADESKWESVLSYAYTKDIDNPEWTYGGIIYDTGGHYTKNLEGEIVKSETPTFNYDNNHGGMVNANGQWYIFGHRNTYIKTGSRQSVAEKIQVKVEGDKLVIDPVEMTSSGLADYLDAFQPIEAAITCYLTPAVDTGNEGAKIYVNKDPWDADENAKHAFAVCGIENESVVGFKYLNFGERAKEVSLRMLVSKGAEGYTDGKVDVYLDAPSKDAGGKLIGSIDLTAAAVAAAEEKETGTNEAEWSWLATEIEEKIEGTHAVYFVFSAAGEGRICDFDQFEFKTPFRFDDVTDESQYYFDPVYWAVDKGITTGTSAAKFSPDVGCTRAQVVTFLWRAAGEPEPETTENPFADVKENAYYYKAVLWAVEKGITKGTTATTFRPDQTCTRGQIVTFLWRYSDQPKTEKAENPFADVAAGEYYTDAVLWAVEKGITTGTTPTTFRPGATCTRAQIVTFLYRAMAQ